MKVPRARSTIRQMMIAVAIVAVTLAVAIAWWDQLDILFAGLLILVIVVGPIALQLFAIYWGETSRGK
jgi:ABC-type arginine/histidine transport system permease subunit